MTGGRSEGYLSKDCEGTGEKTRSDDEECCTGHPHLLPCEEQVEGEDLLLMARDTSPEEETAVVKVKVDRGLVREEVSFAKLVADCLGSQAEVYCVFVEDDARLCDGDYDQGFPHQHHLVDFFEDIYAQPQN